MDFWFNLEEYDYEVCLRVFFGQLYIDEEFFLWVVMGKDYNWKFLEWKCLKVSVSYSYYIKLLQ